MSAAPRQLAAALAMLGGALIAMPGSADSDDRAVRPDLEVLAQLTLDLKDMKGYYHADVLPERAPLVVIQNELLGSGLELNKFGRPVVFLDEKRAQQDRRAYLEFTQIDIQAGQATIQFQYPVEGIAGTARFRRHGKDWRVDQVHIVER